MALKTWVNIPSTDTDAESVINEDFIDDFFNNQEVLCSAGVDCRWAQLTGPGTSNFEVWIPPACATTDEDIVLVVRFNRWVGAGTTGQVRLTLGSGTPVTSSSFTNTTPAVGEVVIAAADVRAVAGTVANLKVETLRSAGSNPVYCENLLGSSHIERRT